MIPKDHELRKLVVGVIVQSVQYGENGAKLRAIDNFLVPSTFQVLADKMTP